MFPPGLTIHDLVANWRFHPSEPLADSTYNGLNLTNSNATQGTVNIHDGWNYSFNGTTSVLDAGSPSLLDNPKPKTIEGWCNAAGRGENGAGWIFGHGSIAGPHWRLNLSGTSVQYFHTYDGDDLSVIGSTELSLSAEHHVAVSWDGGLTATNCKLYIDGAEVAYGTQQDATGSDDTASTNSSFIGNDSTGARTFNGTIGPIRIWNKALTAVQIGWIYNRYR